MKRKNRKTVIITFIIASIFLSACGENREAGTKMEQEPEGLKAAELAVVNSDDTETEEAELRIVNPDDTETEEAELRIVNSDDAEAEEKKTEQDNADAAEAESNGEIDSEDGSNQEQPELYTDEWIKENVAGIATGWYACEKGYMTQEEIDKISQLTHLRSLELAIKGEEVDLSPLGNLTELEYLRINILYDNKADLSFLKHLGNMQELRLEGFASVEDLSFVEGMPHLKFLYLKDVGDTDLNYLEHCRELEIAFIKGKNIRNPEGLTGLPCLEELTLMETMPEEDKRIIFRMDSIGSLENLEDLFLTHMHIDSARPLADMEKLDSVTLGITDIEDISSLEELEGVDQYGYDIFHVYFNMGSLEKNKGEGKTEQDREDAAEAEPDGETDTEDGSNQEQTKLYTDEWIKENVTGIRCCSYREEKGDMIWEDITQEDIDKISRLTQLKSLTLIMDDEEVDLSPLGNLTELEYLHINILSDNNADLSFLEHLYCMRKLRLEGFASVEDLSFVREMPRLEDLYLEDVRDTDLNYFENWFYLISIFIKGKNIRNPEGLTGLYFLEDLTLCETMPAEDEDKRAIFRMDSISSLINFEHLYLKGMRIEVGDVGLLADMKELESIVLDSTDVEDIRSLEELESRLKDGDDRILSVVDEPESGE